MTAFLALMRKDLRLFLGDRRAVLMSVVAPIAIASFFGYLFGGGAGNQETTPIPVMVSNLDDSAFGRDIVAQLRTDAMLEIKDSSPEQAQAAVRAGKATAAFVIPAKFGANLGFSFLVGGKKPEIEMLFDPSHGLEMKMLQGVLMGAVMRVAGKQMTNRPGAPMADSALPFGISTEAVTARKNVLYNGYAHSFGGMGIQFLLLVGVDLGIALLLLRKQGVWKRMRAAPLSRTVLLGSRAASTAVISMSVLMVLFAFARVVYGVKVQGSLAGFLAVCAAFSLMTAAFGLLVATLGKTAEATRGLAILITLLLVMLGGAWAPTFIFPKWLQSVTVAIPTRWAMDGLDAVTWRGLGFSAVAPQIGWLLGCALVFGALAVMRFEWEAD